MYNIAINACSHSPFCSIPLLLLLLSIPHYPASCHHPLTQLDHELYILGTKWSSTVYHIFICVRQSMAIHGKVLQLSSDPRWPRSAQEQCTFEYSNIVVWEIPRQLFGKLVTELPTGARYRGFHNVDTELLHWSSARYFFPWEVLKNEKST